MFSNSRNDLLDDIRHDIFRPATWRLYKESQTIGPGNCHEATSLVMSGLLLDAGATGIKPRANWHMALGLRPLEGGVGLHSWLEHSKFAVVEVAWNPQFLDFPLCLTGRVQDYYEALKIEVLLRVSLDECGSVRNLWPPTREDIDALNAVRRKPITNHCRRAILRESKKLVLNPVFVAIKENLDAGGAPLMAEKEKRDG